MEITEVTKKILRSIKGRSKKHTNFGLSKYEYEKYGLTEWKMRSIINSLVKEGYILKIGEERFIRNGVKMWRNVWKATEKLEKLVKTFTKTIQNINEKILNWCKKQNVVEILREHGVFVYYSGRIGHKKSKITVNKINGAIKNWKTNEKWNLFNYLRDLNKCTTLYFFNHFIGE